MPTREELEAKLASLEHAPELRGVYQLLVCARLYHERYGSVPNDLISFASRYDDKVAEAFDGNRRHIKMKFSEIRLRTSGIALMDVWIDDPGFAPSKGNPNHRKAAAHQAINRMLEKVGVEALTGTRALRDWRAGRVPGGGAFEDIIARRRREIEETLRFVGAERDFAMRLSLAYEPLIWPPRMSRPPEIV